MPSTLFTSWTDYDQALTTTLAAVSQQLLIFDRDLAPLALERRDRQDLLVAFFRGSPQARLQIAVQDPAHLLTAMPRTLRLLATFGHQASVVRTSERLASLRDSMVLADGRHGVVRFDHDHARGKIVTDDEAEISPYQRRFNEILADGGEPVPTSVLGL